MYTHEHAQIAACTVQLPLQIRTSTGHSSMVRCADVGIRGGLGTFAVQCKGAGFVVRQLKDRWAARPLLARCWPMGQLKGRQAVANMYGPQGRSGGACTVPAAAQRRRTCVLSQMAAEAARSSLATACQTLLACKSVASRVCVKSHVVCFGP